MSADHCTLWPDRLAGRDWSACCAQHDRAYADPDVTRLAADLELAACVAEVWPAMALVMFAGVCAFGWAFRRTRRRQRA